MAHRGLETECAKVVALRRFDEAFGGRSLNKPFTYKCRKGAVCYMLSGKKFWLQKS